MYDIILPVGVRGAKLLLLKVEKNRFIVVLS